MKEIPLDQDENVAVFTPSAVENLSDFSADNQREFVNRIITALESSAISTVIEKCFKDVDSLQQLRVGDKKRVYCLLIEEVHGYNVLLVLGWSTHRYGRERGKRERFSRLAERRANELKSMSASEVDNLVSEDNVFTAESLERLKQKNL